MVGWWSATRVNSLCSVTFPCRCACRHVILFRFPLHEAIESNRKTRHSQRTLTIQKQFSPPNRYLLHAFSSDSSLQSGFPLQKSSFSIHSPLPHDNFPSGQIGSSVFRMGNTFLGSKSIDEVWGSRKELATKTL